MQIDKLHMILEYKLVFYNLESSHLTEAIIPAHINTFIGREIDMRKDISTLL
jgi:hypothetical protein